MSPECIIDNIHWRLEYRIDNNVPLGYYKEYWGADNKENILFIYNTKDEEKIKRFIYQAQQQYRGMR